MQPKLRREVFARSDGIVEKIDVRQGQKVAAGDVMVILDKPQLDFEFGRLARRDSDRSGRGSPQSKPRAWPPIATARRTRPDKVNQLTAEEEEAKSSLASLLKQQRILRAQRHDLELRSPLDGTVLTWNAKDLLAARPVARGQSLLTVADLAGDWVVELQVADNRIGHVLAAQQRDVQAGRTGDLPVQFLLATEPGVSYTGKIQRVALATESDKATGATVEVTVAFARDEIAPDQLRPGATVVAKIHCGRRSLGYVWLHELWETIESRMMF